MLLSLLIHLAIALLALLSRLEGTGVVLLEFTTQKSQGFFIYLYLYFF